MQCTLPHKWLDRLSCDLRTLGSFARIQVQEYGPLDLAVGAERLVAVQMICRLLLGLGMAAEFALSEEQARSDAQAWEEKIIEGLCAEDRKNNQDEPPKKKKRT
jgi:hypothetical protein